MEFDGIEEYHFPQYIHFTINKGKVNVLDLSN